MKAKIWLERKNKLDEVTLSNIIDECNKLVAKRAEKPHPSEIDQEFRDTLKQDGFLGISIKHHTRSSDYEYFTYTYFLEINQIHFEITSIFVERVIDTIYDYLQKQGFAIGDGEIYSCR